MPHVPTDQTSTVAADLAAPTERRARVRFRCERPTMGRAFIANTFRSMHARVLDVSVSGVGLLLPEAVPVGTRLNVDFAGHAAMPLEILAEVVHVAQQPDGDWRCGCTLVWEISEQELQLLLK